jgi:hypothetical protein
VYPAGYFQNTFANGNVFASGYLATASISASQSQMFSPGQAGSLNGQLEFALDVYPPADGGWWLVTFDSTNTVVSFKYTDPDLGAGDAGTATWTLTAGQCVVQHF